MLIRIMRLTLITGTMLWTARGQSVDALIREGLEKSSQLKSFDHQIQAAGFRSAAEGALPSPNLGLELSQIPANARNVVNDAISNNIAISQMFMLGGKLSAMSDVWTGKARVLEENRRAMAVQLRAKIRMNYAQLWLWDRRIEIQEKSAAMLEELSRSMAIKAQTNRLPVADHFAIQAEVLATRAKLVDMRSKRMATLYALNAGLGRDDLSAGVTPDSDLSFPALPLSEPQLAGLLRTDNPSLAAMERMKEMNASEISGARRELFPDLMVQAMAMRMPNGMLLTGGSRSVEMIQESAMGMPMQKTEWMYSLMVSISLPFAPWSAERSSGRAEEMQAMNLSLEAERVGMQREMLSGLRTAVARYGAADSLARLYADAVVPTLQQAAGAQTVAYLAGQASIAAVVDARRMELMKQDDYLMAAADREMAFAEIEMMVGSPLR
jgi:outer membrane protein TolC